MENREELKKIGARVREFRKKRKISQVALAKECGLDRNYIGMVERGERNPSYLTILTIANGLKIDPKKLV